MKKVNVGRMPETFARAVHRRISKHRSLHIIVACWKKCAAFYAFEYDKLKRPKQTPAQAAAIVQREYRIFQKEYQSARQPGNKYQTIITESRAADVLDARIAEHGIMRIPRSRINVRDWRSIIQKEENLHMTVKKSISLRLQSIEIRGLADVTLWGGGNGCIQMTPFKVASIDKDLVKANLNDAGFGVQSINGAMCDVYAVYESADGSARSKVYVESFSVGTISEDTLDKYNEI